MAFLETFYHLAGGLDPKAHTFFLDLLAIYLSDPVKCEVVVMPGIACSFVCYTN